MDITLLRSATAADHASVEGTMPLMDEALTREVYVDVLKRLRGIVAAWEAYVAASPHRPPDAFVAARNRLPLLVSDLETFAANDAIPERCELPSFASQAQLMGALYVMEGSRLGGQFIARHVEKVFALEPGHGTAYFRGFGDQTGRMWSEVVERLRNDIPESEADEVVAGAKKMFAAFGAWMTIPTRC